MSMPQFFVEGSFQVSWRFFEFVIVSGVKTAADGNNATVPTNRKHEIMKGKSN